MVNCVDGLNVTFVLTVFSFTPGRSFERFDTRSAFDLCVAGTGTTPFTSKVEPDIEMT